MSARIVAAAGALLFTGVFAAACAATGGANTTPTAAVTSSKAESPSAQPTTGVPPPSGAVGGVSVVLTQGTVQHLCGLDMRVTFIPPSGVVASRADEAFLAAVDATNEDGPIPGAVAPVRVGSVATVLGQRFQVTAVDLGRKRVTVRLLC
jgi:hypothetical protein